MADVGTQEPAKTMLKAVPRSRVQGSTMVTPEGAVTARVETPFERTAPEIVKEVVAEEGPTISVVTVQPGYSLWRIAEETFGDGQQYVQVFAANRDLIRDPDGPAGKDLKLQKWLIKVSEEGEQTINDGELSVASRYSRSSYTSNTKTTPSTPAGNRAGGFNSNRPASRGRGSLAW